MYFDNKALWLNPWLFYVDSDQVVKAVKYYTYTVDTDGKLVRGLLDLEEVFY